MKKWQEGRDKKGNETQTHRADQDPEHNQTKHLHLLLSNIQSINNKELLLFKHLNINNIDIAVITEMQLNDDTVKAWVLTSELNRNGFH